MLRLAISGIDEATAGQIGFRLHRACLCETTELRWPTPPLKADVVMFLGAQAVPESLVAACVQTGQTVVFAAEPCWSAETLARLSTLSNSQFVADAASDRQHTPAIRHADAGSVGHDDANSEVLTLFAASPGGSLAVVNPDRWLPSRRLIHEQLTAGKLGAIGLLRIHRWETQAIRTTPLSGLPGPLLRDLDQALWLFGEKANEVFAIQPCVKGTGAKATDHVQVQLGFVGGGTALVEYSNRLPPGDGYQSLSIIGSAGSASVDDHHNRQLLFEGGRPHGVLSDERLRGLVNLVQESVDNAIARRDTSATLTEWRQTLIVADAVRRSLDSRDSVSLEIR